MKKALILSIIFSISIFYTHLQAATFNVSTTQELRQALSAAAVNVQSDTIVLAAGTYATTDDGGGTFNFTADESYDLTIQGSSPDNVVLSGDNTDRVLKFDVNNSVQRIYLTNISIINGKSSVDGGGIFSYEALHIENCIISGNTADGNGGGFFNLDVSDITITNSIISGNTAGLRGGGFFASGNVAITNSTISGNSVTEDYNGGGFYAFGNADIINSIIFGNTVGNSGGGFYAGSIVTITNSTISGNTAGHASGGFYADNVTITDSTISNNTAAAYGGGFHASGNVSITDSNISDNVAGLNGGGFYTSISGSTVTVTNSIMSGNTAGTYGGGFFVWDNTTITNSIISGNNAGYRGGGFYSSFASQTITNNVINSIIANNYANENGNGMYLNYNNYRILNSILINNGGNEITGAGVTVINCYIDPSKIMVPSLDIENSIFGGNLDFADQGNGDFHIGKDSILIDAGTTSIEGISYPSFDFEGNERISGSAIDIGPYEFIIDTDNDGLTDNDEIDIYGTDPNNPDTDNDGLNDGVEVNILETNPLAVDTDGNGTPDNEEDYDGDGFSNLQEVQCESDPADSSSRCSRGLPWLLLLLD